MGDSSRNAPNCKQNKNNKSGFKGVSLSTNRKGTKKWVASITNNDKKRKREYFVTKEEAIKRRKQMEIEFGYTPRPVV